MDVLSVSIELHTKKEERLTRSCDFLDDTLLFSPKLSLPFPTRQLQATLEDKTLNEQNLKQLYKQNEREKDKALKAIGQERRQLDVERYDPTRTLALFLTLFSNPNPNPQNP
jgi:hypothetical protein